MTTPKFCQSLPASPMLRFPRISRVVLLGVVFSLLCLPLASQATGAAEEKKNLPPYALIFGTVWGPDGVPLYGVTIKIRRADAKNPRKARWELYSDHHGEFAQRVPAGHADYVIWAELKGYKAQDGKKLQPGDEIRVHVENDERVDTGVHLKQ